MEDLIKEFIETDPWVSDPEEGVYCFYCGCEYRDSFKGGIYTHKKDCLYERFRLTFKNNTV